MMSNGFLFNKLTDQEEELLDVTVETFLFDFNEQFP